MAIVERGICLHATPPARPRGPGAQAGCFFEWTYKAPIFGVVEPDFFLYTPILATLGFGGVGASVVLFVQGVSAANEAAERMDKIDGY